jgi:serine/threonine-protein kinase mTOR
MSLTPPLLRSRQRKDIEPAVFMCISMLAVAVGQALTRYMHELLDLMFNCGLSEPLVQAMKSLAENIKPLLPTIQGKESIDAAEPSRFGLYSLCSPLIQ